MGVIQKRASVTSGSNVVCSVHVYGLFSFSSLASKMQNGQKYHLLLLQKPKKMTGGSMDITRVKNPGFFSIEKVIYRKIGLANSNAQLIGAWFTWI